MTKNEGILDRMFRFILGEIFLILGFFWLWGSWQIFSYALSVIMFFTAITGFCGIYKILGIDTSSSKPISKIIKAVFVLLFISIAIAGSYFSDFFSRKFFLDDYNRMNNFYKQTLFNTGQERRQESIENYNNLVSEYALFSTKYLAYHPYVIRRDDQFNTDIEKVSNLILSLKENVYSGDLVATHLEFESIRPIFQDLLKRNNFSMLAVYLVDFHDAMEKTIAFADAKDVRGIITVYPEVDEKLKAIEEVANDEEIKTIRQNFDAVLNLANEGKIDELPEKAAELKSSFVEVYLKRG